LYHNRVTPLLLALSISAPAQLPTLQAKGTQLLNPQGKSVILKGVNVGNWFVIEPWMLDWSGIPDHPADQYEIENLLAKRFGESEKNRLMDLYYSNWITARDFKIIKSFGFNVVRLPVQYRMFEDDAQPFKLKKEAFKWTDRAIKLAADQGLYTILDMHGAQGGQSVYDHTGRSGQNKLWTDPENGKRLAWLWGELAKKYKNNSAVVAYDVFNEPYGGSYEGIKNIFSQSYKTIRAQDQNKLIFAMGFYDGFSFYGTPTENNWKNVGYQMHYYPGMFGNGDPTPLTHAKHVNFLETLPAQLKPFNSNFLIGEMNVVFAAAGGGPLMRKYYDLHAKNGWHTTMWSYKVQSQSGGIGTDTWGMVSNKNPLPSINLRTDSKAKIEQYFKSFSTMPYDINEPLRKALTAKTPPPVSLPSIPKPRTTAPQQTIPGFQATDIGGALKGGIELLNPNEFNLFGGGNDIWGAQDSFRFLHKTVTGDFTLTTQIPAIENLQTYTKAGIMARASLDHQSNHFMITAFPTGELQVAWRSAADKVTEAFDPKQFLPPPNLFLKIQRSGSTFIASSSQDGSTWKVLHQQELPNIPQTLEVGAISLSHDNGQLVKIRYKNFQIQQD
jgi:endoglucanase